MTDQDRCRWVVALSLAVLVGAACDSSRGVPAQSVVGGDAGPIGVGTDAGTPTVMDAVVDPSFRGYYATGLSDLADEAACQSCLRLGCELQIQACEADPACAAWRGCIGLCADPACFHACLAELNSNSASELSAPFQVTASPALDLCQSALCTVECTQQVELFACLEAYVWSGEIWSDPENLGFSVSFINYLADLPVAGLDVRLCDRSDPLCDSPLDEAVSGMDGLAHLVNTVAEADAPPLNYVEVSTSTGTSDPADFGPDSVTVLLFPPSPAFVPGVAYLLPVLTRSQAIMEGAEELQAGRGALLVVAESCASYPAPGLTVDVDGSDGQTQRTYGIGAPVAGAEATTTSGDVVFTNLPAGTHQVTVQLADDGTLVGTASVFVRDGWLSILRVDPLVR